MCNCFNEFTERARLGVKVNIEREKVVEEWINPGNFETMQILDDNQKIIAVPFVFAYIPQTLRHTRNIRNVTTDKVLIRPKYCQFCGEKLPDK